MNDFTVTIVNWPEASEDIFSVRRAVFVREQNIPEEIEFDGRDPACFHVLVHDKDGRPVATARLDKTGRIGRMAVLVRYRRRGLGTRMLRALLDCGAEHGTTAFHLAAQIHAVEFYRKMGFEPYGDEFDEAGIPHVNMKKTD